jgi:threonine/homoserine/homoserine lactone efflux protein
MMVPSPTWFTVLDLGIAYLPMAYLGWKIVRNKKASTY